MTNIAVAMHTRQHFVPFRILSARISRQQRMCIVFVAIDAGILRNNFVARFDLDRVVVVLQREGNGVKKAIVRLREPFSNKIVWQVAIVAHRHMTMAAFLPGVEMFLHHVAVCARLRIVTQVA